MLDNQVIWRKQCCLGSYDVARTTIKETNIHDNRSGNLGANQKGVAYDPNDEKNYNQRNKYTLILEAVTSGANQKGVAYDPTDVARTTMKETIDNNRSGNFDANQEGELLMTLMT